MHFLIELPCPSTSSLTSFHFHLCVPFHLHPNVAISVLPRHAIVYQRATFVIFIPAPAMDHVPESVLLAVLLGLLPPHHPQGPFSHTSITRLPRPHYLTSRKHLLLLLFFIVLSPPPPHLLCSLSVTLRASRSPTSQAPHGPCHDRR